MMQTPTLKQMIEAALFAAGEPLSLDRLKHLLVTEGDTHAPSDAEWNTALTELAGDYEQHVLQLQQVASGYRFQVREAMAPWVSRLWEERPARYTRALLETLALIAYRQPITRGEIEDIRGVSVSTQIFKTLHDREWIRSVGHRDVPGRPALYATTRQFLDYFNLKSLEDLPPLSALRDLDQVAEGLNFDDIADAVRQEMHVGAAPLPDAGEEIDVPALSTEGVPAVVVADATASNDEIVEAEAVVGDAALEHVPDDVAPGVTQNETISELEPDIVEAYLAELVEERSRSVPREDADIAGEQAVADDQAQSTLAELPSEPAKSADESLTEV